MWPWGHLAFGYLAYSTLVHLSSGDAPRDYPALALMFGTQFPDLVDKPLAWSLGILPNGRSLSHSLLVGLVVVGVVYASAARVDRRTLGVGFGVGYLSHLFADALYPLVAGEFHYVGFLAWPIVPAIQYETDRALLAYLASFQLTPQTGFELVLFGVALVVWLRDGTPGIPTSLGSRRPDD